MQVTDVRVHLITGDGKVRALCSVLFDGAFAVHGLRVVEGKSGVFVSMPRRKTTEGKYRDVAHPITKENRDMLHLQVLEAYRRLAIDRAGD